MKSNTYILTSMFSDGFRGDVAEMFQQTIKKKNKFAFVASEFEMMHEKTDRYFEESYVVDGRITAMQVQKTIETADVVWLSGGMTLAQFNYFQKYGLDKIIKNIEYMVCAMKVSSYVRMVKLIFMVKYMRYRMLK